MIKTDSALAQILQNGPFDGSCEFKDTFSISVSLSFLL